MNSLTQRLIKNSTIENTSLIADSPIYGKKDMIPTPVPMVNVALSGRLDGGLTPGLTVIAGPSKHFKSLFSLLMAAAYLKKYKDAVLLFYDSEHGTPEGYFKTFNIDMDRVVYTAITDIEELKIDVSKQLNEIKRNDHVIIVVDSVGNLASRKEVEDALEGKTVADMSRAKALKSLFRIVTPHLSMKDIPMVVVNHTYKEIGLYPRDIVGGGTGIYLSADTIWILGRQQEKEQVDGKATIAGYNFIINVEKSRFVKEKSKIPISVTFEGGIQKWSGILDVALEGGFVTNPSKGWYEFMKKKYRYDDIVDNKEFWIKVLEQTQFGSFITNKYQLITKPIVPSFLSDEEEAAVDQEPKNVAVRKKKD